MSSTTNTLEALLREMGWTEAAVVERSDGHIAVRGLLPPLGRQLQLRDHGKVGEWLDRHLPSPEHIYRKRAKRREIQRRYWLMRGRR